MQIRKFYYGWVIIGCSVLTLFLSMGIWYSFSVFYAAIVNNYGWSRAGVAGISSIFLIVHSLVGIIVGSLLDRFGARMVLPAGALVTAIGLTGCSVSRSLWQLYLFYGIVTASGICSIGWIVNSIIIPRWFSRKRATALGVAFTGIGLGTLVMAPLSERLISWFGLSEAFLILAIMVLFLVAPINGFFQRQHPRDLGLKIDGDRVNGEKPELSEEDLILDRQWASIDWDLRSALCTQQFWCCILGIMCGSYVYQGIMLHQVAHLVDVGFQRSFAAIIVGIVGLIGIPGRIFWGHISDLLGREKSYLMGNLLTTGAVVLLMTAREGLCAIPYIYGIMFGFGYSTASSAYPSVVADIFQGSHFGKIFGVMALAGGSGGAFGAWLNGFLFDMMGHYRMAFGLDILALIISCLMFWMAAPRKVRMTSGVAMRSKKNLAHANLSGENPD